MKINLKEKSGITLIALIIVIVVLVILAGVAITMAFGNNGLVAKVEQAELEARAASVEEAKELWDIEKRLDAESAQSLEELVNSLVEQGVLLENEKDQIIGNAEKEIAATGEITIGSRTIKFEETVKILEAVIPEGFYYVGGTVESGLVISDEKDDKDKYKGKTNVGTDLIGNQFVWVPCTIDGENGTIKYEQHKYETEEIDDTTDPTEDTGNGKWRTYYYRKYKDWKDAGGNSKSVEKYGGFYIGRYEAGYPEKIEAGTTVTSKDSAEGKKPLSKAKVASWNLVSQTEAKTAAESMYSGSTSVESKLIDSYAFDTVCNWIGKGKEDTYLTNSVNYGNYYNSTFTIEKGTMYVAHKYLTAKKDSGASNNWYYRLGGAGKYNYSIVADEKGMQVGVKTGIEVPEDATGGKDKYTADERIEIATGSTEKTKTNNIYDLAGNMYEWTTETGLHNTTGKTFAVLRGGSFNNDGSSNPVVYRSGDGTVGNTNVHLGFRPVLYIK